MPISIIGYLEKFTSSDNDFRYMAVNDLLTELNQHKGPIEPQVCAQIIEGLIRLIIEEQSTSEVKNLAIKCLGPLCNYLGHDLLSTLFSKTLAMLENNKEEIVELGGLTLKTVVNSLGLQNSDGLVKIKDTFRKLVILLKQDNNYSRQYDIIEILIELLNKYGSTILATFDGNPDEQIQTLSMDSIFPLLSHSRPGLKKKASICLGALSSHLKESLFVSLVQKLSDLYKIEHTGTISDSQKEQSIIVIQSFSMLCRSDPTRTGPYLKTIIPAILQHASLQDDILTEQCLHALEIFTLFCPKEIDSFYSQVAKLCLNYISYDPNYIEDDDDNMDDSAEDEFDEFDDEFDDDDDTWKLRRLSAKVLQALVTVNIDQLGYFYEKVAPILIKRFSEREEAVRIEIIQAFIALLKQTNSLNHHFLNELNNDQTEIAEKEDDNIKRRKLSPQMIEEENQYEKLKQLLLVNLSNVIQKISDQINSGQLSTQQISIKLLTQLTITLPNQLGSYIEDIKSNITFIYSSNIQQKVKSNPVEYITLKKESLCFIRELLKTHDYKLFENHISWLCPIIINAMKDPSNKYFNESFSACIEFIRIILPINQLDDTLLVNFDLYGEYIRNIYQTLLDFIVNGNKENASRERSIRMIGLLFNHSGNYMLSELETCISFLGQLNIYELYALPILQAYITILESSRFDWTQIQKGSTILTTFIKVLHDILSNLKKENRSLKLATLTYIASLVSKFGNHFELKSYELLLVEFKDVLTTFELQELIISIQILDNMISFQLDPSIRHHNIKLLGEDSFWSSMVAIPNSIHLQGIATETYSQLLIKIISIANEAQLNITTISKNYIDAFYSLVVQMKDKPIQKQILINLSRCISSVMIGYTKCIQDGYTQFITPFITIIKDNSSLPVSRHISFLILGHLSFNFNLSNHIDLFNECLEAFRDSNSELRTAAAYALGCYTASNFEEVIEKLIEKIHTLKEERYFLLLSLKEAITYYITKDSLFDQQQIESYSEKLWQVLIEDSFSQDHEESSQNLIAECIGKLSSMKPDKFLPILEQKIKSNNESIRNIIIISIRYMNFNEDKEFIEKFQRYILSFLSLLKDDSLQVRKQSILSLTSVAHQIPFIVNKHLKQILPLIFQETTIKPELIRFVDMGLQKIKVDDGLENRKASYECLYTLLDTSLQYLNIEELITGPILSGLKDQHEIKLICHLFLLRFTKMTPNYLIQYLETISQAFLSDLNIKVKDNGYKQEKNQREELVRSIIKVFVTLSNELNIHIMVPGFEALNKMVKNPEGGYYLEYKEVLNQLQTGSK
ncbi:TIP120-domain-containing protein [Neoconidiobolus thromboides FSU 785]|nr:TIP120-domain-containing protein [Neoconidiobolus thromboides FSU 785]